MNDYVYLFLSISGDWLSIAQRVKASGNKTYLYKNKSSQAKGRENTGAGFFDKDEITDDFYEVINKVPKDKLIILFDDNGYGDMATFLRNSGYKVIGGAAYVDKLEYDRSFGLEVMKKIGLETPQEKEFKSINETISFLEHDGNGQRFVFKPHGEDFAGGSKTYTSKNTQDLTEYLEWLKKDCDNKHYKIETMVLQEFVDGIEADFSGYFNGDNFMDGVCILDIEEKKIGENNKGEATGCTGNIIINFPGNKFFTQYLEKLTPILKNSGYVGEISINNIFAKDAKGYKDGQPYGLEFTPRFGWDAHVTEMSLLTENNVKISDFYEALVNKQPFDFPEGQTGCAVRIYTGDPALEKTEVSGRLFSFPPEIAGKVWFYSVSKEKETYLVEDNPVLLVQAVDKSLPTAIKKCYDLCDKVMVPDAYYRTDIGKRAPEAIRFLDKYNWL